MKAVFVSVDSLPDRAQNLKAVLEAAGVDAATTAAIERRPNGKPALAFDPPRPAGLSLSHTVVDGEKIEALAFLDEACDIGIDIELWPHKPADQAFVASISAPEDRRVLQMLAKTGRDAGVALWVIKEAALKCTGEVMTDPRDLAVAKMEANVFRVLPSTKAGSPHPEIDVALHVLIQNGAPDHVLLVGLAMGAGAFAAKPLARAIQFECQAWIAAKFGLD